MRKIKFYLGIGIPGAHQEEIIEFEDDVTDEEIKRSFIEWRENLLDGSWWDVGDEE